MMISKKYFILLVILGVTSRVSFSQKKLTAAQNFIQNLKDNNEKFAYTKGNFNVTDNGELNYEIPIVDIYGTAGMTPKVSLQYNSNGGSGIMGEGWSIAGLSFITRTSKSMATDGETGRINFDENDRLILDGQRLINIDNSKPYWPNSSDIEYRTELNTFKQIKAFYVGSEVKRFEVKTKDGLIYYYGATPSTDQNLYYLKENVSNQIISWLLVRIEDRNGNQIDFEYNKDALQKQFIQPTFINYTGFKNQPNSQYAHIQFNYDNSDYPDNLFLKGLIKQNPVTKFINGQKIIYNEYLTSIICYYNDGTSNTPVHNKIRKYKIHYKQGINDNRKIYVNYIDECLDNDECLKTDFSWLTENEKAIFTPSGLKVDNSNEIIEENYDIYTGDFNGDGLLDQCAIRIESDSIKFVFSTNEKGNFKTISKYSIAVKIDNKSRVLVGDFDANGTTDFSFNWMEKNYWKFINVYTSINFSDNKIIRPTADSIYKRKIDLNIKWNEIFYLNSDFNADGLQDIVCYYYLNNNIILNYAVNANLKVFKYPIAQKFVTTFTNENGIKDTIPKNTPFNLGDYNSDGINDFLFTWTDGKYWHSITSLLQKGIMVNSQKSLIGSGDINPKQEKINYSAINVGKGKIDTVYIDSIIGIKTTSQQIFPNINFPPTKSVYVLDVNHDGNADLLISYMDSTGWKVWTAIGMGNGNFEQPIKSNIDKENYQYLYSQSFGDFNGDGIVDICYTHSNQQGWFAKVAYGKSDGIFSNKGQGELTLDNSNYSYQNNQPSKGMFPCENYVKGYGEKCKGTIQTLSGNPNIDPSIVGDIAKSIEFILNASFKNNLLPTADYNSTSKNFYSGFIYTNKPKQIDENDINFKRVKEVKVLSSDGNSPGITRVKVTVNNNCQMQYVLANPFRLAEETVYYPNSMVFTFVDYWKPLVADLNGDGVTDFAITYPKQPESNNDNNKNNPLNGSWKTVTAFNEAKKCNKIDSIHLGNDAGIKIKYKNTVEDGAFDRNPSVSYPFVPYNVPINVVKSTASPNGIGGTNTVEYEYKNGIINLAGRGFIGFEKNVSKSIATNQQTIKTNLIDSTFLSFGLLPLKEITSSINKIIISSEKYENKILSDDYNHQIIFNCVKKKESSTYDLLSNLINTSTSIYEYDRFGNLVFNKTEFPNGQSVSISNEYWESSETQIGKRFNENWIIGRLSKTTVNKTHNPNPQINRTSEFEYDNTTGQLTLEKTLTGTIYQINKEYFYDIRGNKIKEKAYPERSKLDTVVTEYNYSQENSYRFLINKKDALGYTIHYVPDIIYGVNKEVFDNDENKASIGFDAGDYDPFGRWKKSYSPDSNFTYEATYKCKNCNIQNAVYFKLNGNSQSKIPRVTFYDVLDRPVKTVSFDINYNKIVKKDYYDSKGRVIKTTLPYFEENTPEEEVKFSSFFYDDIGRITKTINPDNTENIINYDGLVTHFENAKHQKNSTTNDLLGRKITEINNRGDSVNYKYDLDGNLSIIINQKGELFQTDYDLDLGKQIRNYNPHIGHMITYAYNEWGEVELIKSGVSGKNIIEIKYDKIGRIISRKEAKYTYSNGVNAPVNLVEDVVSWEYIGSNEALSGKGKLKKIKVLGDNRKIDKSFQYDKYGRLIKKNFKFNNLNSDYDISVKDLWDDVIKDEIYIGYTYNSLGQLDSIKYPKLKSVFYKKDFIVSHNYENGLIKSIVANGKKIWEYKEGYADGTIKSILLNDGKTSTDYSYDPTNKNLNRITTSINGTQIQDWNYTYDEIGNVISKVDQKNSSQFKEQFDYDNLNRISKTSINGKSVNYRYDNLGNIIYKSDLGYYKYNESFNKIIIDRDSLNYIKDDEGMPGDMDDLEYYKDALGNRSIKEIKEIKQFEIGYTHFNKPDNIYNYTTGAKTDFFYDEDNNAQIEFKRVDRKNSCKFYIDGLFEFEVKEGFSVEQKFYISINGSIIALNEIDNFSRSDNLIYLHKDALGTITATSNNTKLLSIFAYDIWGQRRNPKTWATINFEGFTKGFTGHQHWDDLGLINMGGRIFDPIVGQFLQVDPILNLEVSSLGLTPYGYCYNNPLYYTDPTGYWFGSKFLSGVGNFFKDVGRGIVRGLILSPLTGFNPLSFVIANMPGVSGFIDKNAGLIVAVEISVAMMAIGVPPIAAGFAVGFGSSFSQTYLNGGSIGQSLEAGLISGTICGVTAGITQGIGSIFTNSGGAESTALFGNNEVLNQTGKALTHAAFQGLMNEAQGGNFRDGALPALVSSASDCIVGQVGGSDVSSKIERTAIAGTLGGTASVLGGGKFANGAATASIVHMYNYEGHIQGSFGRSDLSYGTPLIGYDIDYQINGWQGELAGGKYNFTGSCNLNGDCQFGLSTDIGEMTYGSSGLCVAAGPQAPYGIASIKAGACSDISLNLSASLTSNSVQLSVKPDASGWSNLYQNLQNSITTMMFRGY